MLIMPAIDLRDGRVVRLHQGDYEQETRYPDDPLVLAKAYAAQGAQWLHLVDLDGARIGSGQERAWIRRLAAQAGLHLQCGGGVRSRADVDQLLDAGVRRVVIGSLYAREPALIGRWVEELGADRLVIALDVRAHGQGWDVQVAGWRESAGLELSTALERARQYGVRQVLITDIGRDGTLGGPAVALYHAMAARFPELQLQASGGVATLEDLQRLATHGAHAVVIGKALLEGRFTVAQALALQGMRAC